MTYDPETWDEEQLHAALSTIRTSPDLAEPRSAIRWSLDELLGRPIDDAHLVLGGMPLMRGALRPRPERDLAALPPHALLVIVSDLPGPRFFAIPGTVDPAILQALEIAHGATIGDTDAAQPTTYPSVLRVAAGTIEPKEADTFFILHVMDFYEDWEGKNVALPSLEDIRAWAGWLLPYRVTEVRGLDLCITQVCSILDDA